VKTFGYSGKDSEYRLRKGLRLTFPHAEESSFAMGVRSILAIGHRGAAGHGPENTLVGLAKGIALGADYLEIDVQRTRDGRFVLMHDKFVDRTTSGKGKLTDFSSQELRKLEDGDGQYVPLLEEALELCRNRVGMVIEIITPGIGRDVYKHVAEFAFPGPLIFSSFLHAEIRAIREMDSGVETMALIEAIPIGEASFAHAAGATHVGAALDSMTSEFSTRLHDSHLKVFIYTPNLPHEIAMAAEMGADGIISDFPDRVRAQLAR